MQFPHLAIDPAMGGEYTSVLDRLCSNPKSPLPRKWGIYIGISRRSFFPEAGHYLDRALVPKTGESTSAAALTPRRYPLEIIQVHGPRLPRLSLD